MTVGAHPRSRGENFWGCSAPAADWGSSPLTRGKPERLLLIGRHVGLIPAHAGKTIVGTCGFAGAWAHPRSRGENAGGRASRVGARGSSPLTRGKLQDGEAWETIVGLIPAHAGKTIFQALLTRTTGAHPRSRGENAASGAAPTRAGGSSPLTRGKLTACGVGSRPPGLIPAHAGKTLASVRIGSWNRAHPRSRGENNRSAQAVQAKLGSSPLTRGKPAEHARQALQQGLIPAHAGKTRREAAPCCARGAHPRSRGENPPSPSSPLRAEGSSPLTRGKRQARRHEAHPDGLIPAHAGKTADVYEDAFEARAHPRSRGENTYVEATKSASAGSSPLTRGKRNMPRLM